MAEQHDDPDMEVRPEANGDARAEFEEKRLSRRKVLRKMGFTTVLTGGFFLWEEVARAVFGQLEAHKLTQGIADDVARDFRELGVAHADTIGSGDCDDCGGECVEDDEYECVDCDPSCSTTAAAGSSGGNKKKKKKVCDPKAYVSDCQKNSPNIPTLDCCQTKCNNECKGTSSGTRDALIELCMEGCCTQLGMTFPC